MTAFQNWFHSLEVGQQLLAGHLDDVLRDLPKYWDGAEEMRRLSADKLRLKQLTQRTARALNPWFEKAVQALRDGLGRAPKPKAMDAVESVIETLTGFKNAILAFPPRQPAEDRPSLLVWVAKQHGNKALVKLTAAAFAGLPRQYFELVREHEGNPWLAAVLVQHWFDGPDIAAQLPWLTAWARRKRLKLPVGLADKPWTPLKVSRKGRWNPVAAAYVTGLMEQVASAQAASPGRSPLDVDEVAVADEPVVTKPAKRAGASKGSSQERSFTIKEAAARFSIPVWTLRHAIRLKELPSWTATAAPNAPQRLKEVDLLKWVESRKRNQGGFRQLNEMTVRR